MLHLLARLEMITSRGFLLRYANAVLPTESGQRGIGQRDVRGSELFVDSDDVSLAACVELSDRIDILTGLLFSQKLRHVCHAAAQYLAYDVAGKLQRATDHSDTMATSG